MARSATRRDLIRSGGQLERTNTCLPDARSTAGRRGRRTI
jgi:hypothetical protein